MDVAVVMATSVIVLPLQPSFPRFRDGIRNAVARLGLLTRLQNQTILW